MHPVRPKVTTVDEYIALFSGPASAKLHEIRRIIKATAPEAEEIISYSIPAYKYHGQLVFFSAYTKHVSISFPPHSIFEVFKAELSPYKYSKSTVQFPLDQGLPEDLIKHMVAYKMQENLELEAAKRNK